MARLLQERNIMVGDGATRITPVGTVLITLQMSIIIGIGIPTSQQPYCVCYYDLYFVYGDMAAQMLRN